MYQQFTSFARWALAFASICCIALCASPALAAGSLPIVQLSADPFTNAGAAHATEVETDNAAFGNTMVGVFQVGRFQDSDAGSTDIGWATSSDAGGTWKFGYIPKLWVGPPFESTRITDPAVAYDAKHHVWMLVSLPRGTSHGVTTYLVPIINRSPDGMQWQAPVHIEPDNGDFMDKPWIACDNASTSPYYGNCYVEFIDVNLGEVLLMSTSSDGGATWSKPSASANSAAGNGGQPVVQPNGNVIIPFLGGGIEAVSSSDGGASWQSNVFIANVNEQSLPGGIRDPGPLPSARVDGKGAVYVAWWDCSFRANCSSNDIVYSTSSDGKTWSAITRVPIDATTSGVDHFLPGIAIDPATSGSSAHIGLTYYYLANANCSFSTCEIYAGFISSTNAGASWNPPTQLAGPMMIGWLPNSDLGYMIGDYEATSFMNGLARATFPVATAKNGSVFDEAVYTTKRGLAIVRAPLQRSSRGDRRLPVWSPVKPRPVPFGPTTALDPQD